MTPGYYLSPFQGFNLASRQFAEFVSKPLCLCVLAV
jgi:hypothetical protein